MIGELLGEGENGETVLVVEDDDDVRAYLTDVIRSLGYAVAVAPNGTTALDILEQPQIRIDLMLTDVVMPGMNGRELAKKAQAARPKLKVISHDGVLAKCSDSPWSPGSESRSTPKADNANGVSQSIA
jgi:CheY-like chemotaxis protein